MKHLAKRIFPMIIASLIISLGVSGCMKKSDPEAIKDQMITYLQEKYGEEFVPISFESSGFAYSYDTLWVYPKDGTKADRFEVRGSKAKDNTYVMSDGYYGIYIKPQYEAVLSGFVGEIYKDYKLFTDFGEGVWSEQLNKDTKIEEIYEIDRLVSSSNVIFVKEDSAKNIDDEEAIRQIAENMKAKKMVGNIQLYVVYNDKFDSIGLEALSLTNAQMKDVFVRDYEMIKVNRSLEVKKYGEGT